MGKNIIGLVGFIGSGKNSVADILISNHGFTKESFASPLKDAVSVMFGWDRALLEGDTEESRLFRETPDKFWSEKMGKPFSPRYAMQLMGTEVGRGIFYENLWVDALEKRITKKVSMDEILRQESRFVITDVRFPNEIDKIKSLGGHVFRVKRGEEPPFYETALATNLKEVADHASMVVKFPNVHYSEWAWIGHDIDGTISNHRSLEELEDNVKYVIQDLNH